MRLIHLTDPHLTSLDGWRPGLNAGKRWLSWLSWQSKRRARHRPARLSALVKHLKAVNPDAWAITGDLCQIGLEREARAAAAWLADLAPPENSLLVPGNHDIFALDSGAAINRQWADYLHVDPDSPQWPVVRRFDDVTLIGVNSAIVTPILNAGGRLGSEMRQRLDDTLARHLGSCRFVLIHHPPVPGSCKPRKALADDRELSELLAARGCAVVLHGHLHHNREYRLDSVDGSEISVFCTAPASAAGPQGAAAARIFDVERAAGGYRIVMRLEALDASNRAHTIERREWLSAG